MCAGGEGGVVQPIPFLFLTSLSFPVLSFPSNILSFPYLTFLLLVCVCIGKLEGKGGILFFGLEKEGQFFTAMEWLQQETHIDKDNIHELAIAQNERQ